MSRTDFLPSSDPVRLAKTFHDSEAAVQSAVPHAALALLPVLHRQAGRDLDLWRFLGASPQFCMALMLEGAAVLALGSGSLDAAFVWTSALLLGIAAVAGNHIRGVASSPRYISLTDAARELRLLLLYLGIAWGFGAFLILPHKPALTFLFAALPSLSTALILKEDKSTLAFAVPTAILSAGAVFLSHGAGNAQAWAAVILLAGLGIAGFSMVQCAIVRRHAQDLH